MGAVGSVWDTRNSVVEDGFVQLSASQLMQTQWHSNVGQAAPDTVCLLIRHSLT
jgi:hypothetical protein